MTSLSRPEPVGSLDADRRRSERSVAAELRLAGLLPLPAFANGGLFSLAAIALYALARWAWGPSAWLQDGGGGRLAADAHDFAVSALAFGFAIGSVRYTFEANGRDLRALLQRGMLKTDVPTTPLLRKSTLARARWAGLAGAVAGLIPAALLQPYATAPGTWPAGWVCAQLAYLVVCCLIGRAIWFSVETARFFEAITPERSAIDLLDPAPLYLFGRMGLRLSFTWVVGLTLFSLLTLFGTRATATAAAPVLLAIALTAGMALIVPVRTLRQRIRAAKAAERVRLDGEIRRLRDETARGEHSADGRIADLCALRERVEAVRDWPFESLMLLEFLLHLMIPLAPFFGGALVHHLVSRVFDPGK